MKKNCLLTRFPLVFVHEKQRFAANYRLSSYLRAHGYQILTLTFASCKAEKFAAELAEIGNRFHGAHLITTDQSLSIDTVARNLPFPITMNSYDEILCEFAEDQTDNSSDLRAFLSFAVHLAEKDFVTGF